MKKCKSSKKKAQSAMEYLMTYGWAILIVIIVAAALYALGVFNPATFTGPSVTGFNAIGKPTDWVLTANGDLKLKLRNMFTTRLNITNIDVTINNKPYTNLLSSEVIIDPNTDQEVTLATGDTFSTGATYSAQLKITYNTGGYDKIDTGTLTGVVS
ncbi:MAG: hypothetical protein QW051_01870 [Candidatus Aenigmatarchaeota archaeon]